MKTRKILSLLLALALLAAAALTAQAETLTDMAGRELVLDAPLTRVIALNPADCEILYALGAQDVLVGRGEYCNYPEDVLSLPSVNSGAQTNIEQILALEPEVIIMSKMAQTVEQVEALEKAGVRVVISDAQSLEASMRRSLCWASSPAGRRLLRRSRRRCGPASTRFVSRRKPSKKPCILRSLPWSGACGPVERTPSWMSLRRLLD